MVLQEHTSQIQDFSSTSVQFQDSSCPEKSKLRYQDFSGPWRYFPSVVGEKHENQV